MSTLETLSVRRPGDGGQALGGGPGGVQPALSLATPQVKWIFSSVVELKQTIVPDYRNMIGQGA